MSQTYGIESPKTQSAVLKTKPVRFVVVIEEGGTAIARLLLENHQQVDELDAGAPEVAQMIQGLHPKQGAQGEEWNTALRGHSQFERSTAVVYTLIV